MAGEDSEQAGNGRVSRWEQAGVSSTRDPSGSWMKFSSESHSSGDDCYFPLLRAGIRPLLLPDRREPFTFLVVVFRIQVSWNVNLSLQKRTWIHCFVPVLPGRTCPRAGEVHVDLLRRRECRFDSCCCRRSKWSRSGTRVCWSWCSYAGAHAAGTIGASAFIFLVVVAVQAPLIKPLELGSAKPEMSGDRPANYPTLPTRIPRPTKVAVKPQHTACRRARLSRSGLSAGCTIGECARRSRSWRD